MYFIIHNTYTLAIIIHAHFHFIQLQNLFTVKEQFGLISEIFTWPKSNNVI